MDVNDPNNSDLSQSFLIRDKSGQFKKVEDGQIVDVTVPKTAVPARREPPAPEPLPKPPMPPVTPPLFVPQKPAPSAAIAPRPMPVMSAGKAPLNLEPEDIEEIEQHARDLEAMGGAPQLAATVALNTAIEEILRESGVRLEDDLLIKRFSKVLESRLRDIRTSIEAREVLMRPKKIGGIELSSAEADRVLNLAEQRAAVFHEAGVAVAAQPRTAEAPRANLKKWGVDLVGQGGMFAPTPPAFVPKPGEVKKELPKPFVPSVEQIPPEPAQQVAPVKPPALQSVTPLPVEPVAPARSVPIEETPAVPAPQPVQPMSAEAVSLYARSPEELPKRTPIPSSIEPDRPQMVDIRQPMHIVGPVEEIGEIDLKEFRRLGTNPQESAEKVLEKIDLLEEDSYQRRSEGVGAWKLAPVFKLYIDIGRESIDTNRSIEQILTRRAQENHPTLLMEEFLAINNLNSTLGV
ncbi:MAG: hypothetical protein PHY34_02585 [Patescibacteria group bacterium]|nr:hypothetical protein [Patescibacteria group bacterium]MDD5715469.1 hypothetical protein [Patescibacteria group bacterium]